jgi:hypothetical protein
MSSRRKVKARVLTLWVSDNDEIKEGTLEHLELDYVQPIQMELARHKAEELHKLLGELLNSSKHGVSVQITGRMTIQ